MSVVRWTSHQPVEPPLGVGANVMTFWRRLGRNWWLEEMENGETAKEVDRVYTLNLRRAKKREGRDEKHRDAIV